MYQRISNHITLKFRILSDPLIEIIRKWGKRLNPSIVNELEHAIKKIKIKSWLILIHDELAFEYYKNKKIQKNPQKINSCTKSIISILIGIAIDKGFINLTETIGDYFPEKLRRQEDSRKQ